MLRTKENAKSPQEFVWFEHQIMLTDDLLEERIQTEKYPCPKDYEFVWFDESETFERINNAIMESDFDKQMKKLFESNTNMLL